MANERTTRLLVAMDNAFPCEPAVRIVAALMGSGPMELTGLFVEDEDLLRAARLPGAREISLAGATQRLDPDTLARDVAAAAAAARQAFESLARHLQGERGPLRHNFEVSRGRTAEELERVAAAHDGVVVTRAYRVTGIRPRAGRAFLSLARQPRSMLFINEPWNSGASIVVVDDQPAALARAARIAAGEGLPLIVTRTPGAADATLPAGAQRRTLPVIDEASLIALCREVDARLLILPSHADIDWSELLVSLLDKLECSLLKLEPI
jgi:hypothetical protein